MSVRVPFSKSSGKNVPFSCEREAYPSNFSPFSKCAGRHRVNAVLISFVAAIMPTLHKEIVFIITEIMFSMESLEITCRESSTACSRTNFVSFSCLLQLFAAVTSTLQKK